MWVGQKRAGSSCCHPQFHLEPANDLYKFVTPVNLISVVGVRTLIVRAGRMVPEQATVSQPEIRSSEEHTQSQRNKGFAGLEMPLLERQ